MPTDMQAHIKFLLDHDEIRVKRLGVLVRKLDSLSQRSHLPQDVEMGFQDIDITVEQISWTGSAELMETIHSIIAQLRGNFT